MFLGSNVILFLTVLSGVLIIIGFGFRSHNGGIMLLGIGLLIALGLIVRKALEVFG